MTSQDRILIEILAATDAIFRPMRQPDWTPPAPANLFEARQRFFAAGVPFGTGGGGEARRKTQQREVSSLAEAGLLILCGDKRRAGVRLTEPAETGIRALCGLPSLAASHQATRRLIALSGVAGTEDVFCPELWLAGLKNYRDTDACRNELWETFLLLAPAILRGYVRSRSDVCGRVYYFATEEVGWTWAAQSAPTLPRDLPRWSEPAGRLYHEFTIAARSRLRTARPSSPSEIGEIPIPCSINLKK